MWLFFLLLPLQQLLIPLPKEGELVDENDGLEVYKWLVDRLIKRLDYADGWNIAQEAMELSLPTARRSWDFGQAHSFAVHLVYVATDLRRNHVRRKGFQVVPDHEDDVPLISRSKHPDCEEVLLVKESHGRMQKAAREHFADSPLVLPILEKFFSDKWGSDEEHAEEHSLAIKQVQNARDRITRFVHDERVKMAAHDEAKPS